MKYKRFCPFCKQWRDEWEMTVVEDGLWIRPICEDCAKISPLPNTVPINTGEPEEHRARADVKDSPPQLNLFKED